MDEEEDPIVVIEDDTAGNQQLDFGWDLSLRAVPMRGGQLVSKWLWKESETDRWVSMKIDEDRREMKFGFKERLKHEWNSNKQGILVKLKKLGLSLNSWAKKEKKLREHRTAELNARLFELIASEISDVTLEEITGIKLELNLEADKEDIFWEQRARTNWLQIGDKNTTFFHRSASYRKKKNMVKGLENEPRNLVTEFDEISKMAIDYFKDLFSSKEVDNYDRLLASILPCIIDELNRELIAEFKVEEVVVAMKSISPLIASGKDVFPVIFYQKYWHVVGDEVTRYLKGMCTRKANHREYFCGIQNSEFIQEKKRVIE
ncbi:hypothetical protein J1N35_044384 [Gossypium stocksii]|uniref:Reverse transcriptase n=1 Tax=Gossypium stocksii TaxID=47602 RepID=A0A9D3ZFY3_9ROSI|nr:hypothetical protein J1N35_044384 [Gossypium stocksii]